MKADLSLEPLRQLVGLVKYDADNDPFPVTGWDAICFVVGNAAQAAHYYARRVGDGADRLLRSRERQPRPQVLRAQVRVDQFVLSGAVSPDSPLVQHHAQHGDGVVDIALEYPT